MGYLTAPLSRLSVADKHANIVPLVPNWAQSIYLEEVETQMRARKPIRLITLKARQLGISTITEAFIYCMSFILPNTRAAVIADEVDNSNHLLSMTDLYWELDPLKVLYTTKYQAKNTLHWVETGSSIRTMTAGNKKAGRSRTLHMLHASEVAFWMEAEKVMTGLLQTIPQAPRTFICIESTANGIGNYFNKTWNAAMSGEIEYAPLFFPWWCHPEYRASYINLPYESIPASSYDDEEKNLLILFQHGLDIGQRHYTIPPSEWENALAWRRWAIRNLCQSDINKFHQEYPSYPEEAFIATGTNVFPQQHLGQCFKPFPGRKGRLIRDGNSTQFVADLTGPLTLFMYPTPDTDYGQYVIGGDATMTMHGDYACAQVVNRRTLEQVAIWRGRITPAHFGEELAKLGNYYNMALVASENEGPGYASIGALINMDYPNLYQSEMPENLPGRTTGKYGWSSSYKTKEFAVGWTLKLVVDHEVTIHDRATHEEMTNYVRLENGEYGPASDEGNDDTVMALVIAIASHVLSGPLPAYGLTSASNIEPERPVWESWNEPVEDSAWS